MELHPVLGWAALAVPGVVALALWLHVRRRRRVARAFGDPELVRQVTGADLRDVPWRRVVPVLLAAAALGIAVADPRWGVAGPGDVQGGTVALVLDASGSMLAEDEAPSRLEAERNAARELLRALRGAAVGVVVFAGRAYALAPPTLDAGAVELYLDALDPAMVTQGGSSLASAIRQGVGLLVAGRREGDGALVLISDGDAQEDLAPIEEAVDLARRAGVPVYVLGAGTAQGAPVPDVDLRTGRQLGYKREPGGELVVSRLNEELLRRIAEATGGAYAPLGRPDAVERLAELLRARVGGGEGGGTGGGPAPRYAWFAAAALLFLLAESWASRTTRRRPV